VTNDKEPSMTRLFAPFALPLALALALASCSSGTTDPTTQQAPPRTVSLVLEPGAASTARVPLTGGTITATGEDGTRFTLVIPDGALLEETEITVTPVRTIVGLPFSRGLGGAVQLSPDGLRLYAHATLTIEPAHPVAPTEQVSFGWAGAGRDFHLAPSLDGASLKLLHFSGYGVAGAAPGELAAQAAAAPLDLDARLEQEVARLLAEQRYRELMGDDSGTIEFYRQLQAVMDRYGEQVLKPLTTIPPTTCAEAGNQLTRVFMYSRTMTLMNLERPAWLDGMIADALEGPLYTRASHVCFDEAYARCVRDRDILGMVQATVSNERWRQLNGGQGEPDPYGAAKTEECRQKLQSGGEGNDPGNWSGKLTIDYVGTDTTSRQFNETRSHVVKLHYEMVVTGVAGAVGADTVLNVKTSGSVEDIEEFSYDQTESVDCNGNGRIDTRIDRGNGRAVAMGTIAGHEQTITVHFDTGLTYSIMASTPKIPSSGNAISYMFHKGACNPFNDAEHTDTHVLLGNAGGDNLTVRAYVPTIEADVLSGTDTEQRQYAGLPTTITTTWSFRRGAAPAAD
jgi:hypothetical protein